jgi:signal transduction histidine kinase
MLLASEARSDPITLNEVDCTIGEIVELSVAAMSKFAALAEADISLVSPIRQQEICCDRQLVARAVSKLIDNAVKFSQRGVKITVGAIRLDDGRLAFLVKDNGPGISTGKLASLRQPFEQLDMSLRRSKEGLGLGLPLVQAIAVAHGGEFRLTSTPGEGTQALLLLPESRFSGAPASRTQRKRGAA